MDALNKPDLMPADIVNTAELLSLYLAIKSEPARAKVLAEARAAVAAQSGRPLGYPDG